MRIKSINIAVLSFVLALGIIAGSIPQNAEAAAQPAFTDVKKGAWYEAAVQWGIANQIIKGYSDGSFKPSKTVTEAEFLAMLLRTYEPNLSTSNKGNWADAYYARAKQLNYPVQSYTVTTSRNKVLLRKQVAELISATEGVNFKGDNAIRYMLAFGLAQGSNPDDADVKSFEGNKALTRTEALQFIKNMKEYGIGGLLERPVEASNPQDIPQI